MRPRGARRPVLLQSHVRRIRVRLIPLDIRDARDGFVLVTLEAKQVVVLPATSNLDCVVQVEKGRRSWHLQTTPDPRLGIAQ
jgi:hypothetical protein